MVTAVIDVIASGVTTVSIDDATLTFYLNMPATRDSICNYPLYTCNSRNSIRTGNYRVLGKPYGIRVSR